MTQQSLGREQDACHLPVMTDEVRDLLVRDSTRLVLDCTVGSGGHAAAILEASPDQCVLYGIDLDDQALRLAGKTLSRFGRRVVLKRMSLHGVLIRCFAAGDAGQTLARVGLHESISRNRY